MSESGSVSVVVFDLGNVLIPWDRRFLYESMIPDEDELSWFLDNVLTLAVNARLDRGTPLPVLADELIEAHPDQAERIDAFRHRWIETVGDPIAGSVTLLNRLRSTPVRLLALSNWGADTFETARPRYPFLEWFEGMIISGQEGIVKPDVAIYELLCERFEVRPEEALFIDDSAANIEAASQLGFHTHHFSSPELLALDLADRQLLA